MSKKDKSAESKVMLRLGSQAVAEDGPKTRSASTPGPSGASPGTAPVNVPSGLVAAKAERPDEEMGRTTRSTAAASAPPPVAYNPNLPSPPQSPSAMSPEPAPVQLPMMVHPVVEIPVVASTSAAPKPKHPRLLSRLVLGEQKPRALLPNLLAILC